MISSATSRIGPSTTLRAKTVAINATPMGRTIRPSTATPTPLMSSAPMPEGDRSGRWPVAMNGGGGRPTGRGADGRATAGRDRGLEARGRSAISRLEVTHGDRGIGEPDAFLELVVREAPEQRVLAQEGHHALTFGVGHTELGVRHGLQCGCSRT